MTLTQLEYVLAVYKFKHFSKAAKSCFVTQPTLSMQLQKLEEELELIIFDRSKSPTEPTPEGRLIVEQAQKIIHEQKKMFSLIEESKEELCGDFKIAIIPTLTPYLAPLFIQNFIKRYPKINFQIQEAQTEVIIEMLKKDEVDAALLATPLHEKSLEERVLYYEPFYLFVSNKHPFYQKKTIKEHELDINEIWLLNKGNCFRDQILNICSQAKEKSIHNPINFESGNFETLKNMVLKGFGYTILPHLAVKQLSSPQKKMVRPFKAPIPTREISLVISKNCLKKRAVDALEEELLGSIPDDLRNTRKTNEQVIEFT